MDSPVRQGKPALTLPLYQKRGKASLSFDITDRRDAQDAAVWAVDDGPQRVAALEAFCKALMRRRAVVIR